MVELRYNCCLSLNCTGTLSTLVKSKQSLQNVQGAIETTSVDSCKGDPQVRAHEDKALDFNVDLDALETLDINFDIIHQDNNNKHSNQHLFKNLYVLPIFSPGKTVMLNLLCSKAMCDMTYCSACRFLL